MGDRTTKDSGRSPIENKWGLAVLAGLALFTLSCKGDHGASALEGNAPDPGLVSRLPQLTHSNESISLILKEGRQTNSREIAFVVDSLQRHAAQASENSVSAGGVAVSAFIGGSIQEILKKQADILLADRNAHPQTIKFNLYLEKDLFRVKPEVTWNDNPKIVSQLSAPLVIIGGEFSSVTTAMRAAKNGTKTTLVYSGELGGLVSENGGNLRYFDTANNAIPTLEHREIMNRLSVPDMCSVPKGVGLALEQHVKQNYGDSIQLVRVPDYSGLVVMKNKQNDMPVISGVITQDGTALYCGRMIDTTPESIIAEKAGLALDPRGPQLGDGLVFDVDGLTTEEIEFLGKDDVVSVDQILGAFGLNRSDAEKSPSIQKAIALFESPIPATRIDTHQGYGFCALANGYELFMRCKEQVDPSAGIKFLNSVRVATGFNVAVFGGSANFNSISYRWPYQKLQGEHNIYTDPDLKVIPEVEIPSLNQFFRLVLGRALYVEAGDQLYIRRPTAMLKAGEAMVSPFSAQDLFKSNPRGEAIMSYGNDYRAALKRDAWDPDPSNFGGTISWRAESRHSQTVISNFYVIGKPANTNSTFGAGRILMGDIKEGAALVDSWRSN